MVIIFKFEAKVQINLLISKGLLLFLVKQIGMRAQAR